MAARTESKQQQRGKQSTQEDDRSRSRQQRSESGGQQQGQQQTGLAQRQQSMATPALVTSPFSFMRRFGEGMEQLFSDFGFGGMMPRGFGELAAWTPQVEMFQREGELVIRADLPGLNKDSVQVELRDDAAVIRGERQDERREEREGVYSTERTYGRFYREIPLPQGVNIEEAEARFRDGVLEITMPLEEAESRGRQLEIQDAQSEQQQQGRPRAQAAGAGR